MTNHALGPETGGLEGVGLLARAGGSTLTAMARPKRTFEREFKLQVARQLVSGSKRLSQICREHNLCQSLARNWQVQYEEHGENAWADERAGVHVPRDAEARIAALEAALGRAHLENEFLRQALASLEKRGSVSGRNGR
jgi:transposase-like protein